MKITTIHKNATPVISVRDVDDHEVISTIYHAETVYGPRYWFEKRIEGRVFLRHSTMILDTVREWLDTLNDACNEGDMSVVEMHDATIKHIRS